MPIDRCSPDRTRRAAGIARVVACVLSAICVSVAGCRSVQAASGAIALAATPEQAEAVSGPTDAALPWPARWGDGEGRRGVIVPMDGPLRTWIGVRLGEHHFLRASDREYADAEELAEAIDAPSGFRFRSEGPGAYVFVRDPQYEGPDAKPMPPTGADEPRHIFKFVSGKQTQQWGQVQGVEIQRTWFALYDRLPGSHAEPRGVVVLLPGMFGTPEPVIETVVRTLRRDGWAVLRMLSHPSRFTERISLAITPGSEATAGAELAQKLTDRAAECAYAVQAAMDHAEAQMPVLRGRPAVLLGMSGGAIALPTVHALEPERYAAAVLIAGGVGFLEINLASNYAEWIEAIELIWVGPTNADGEAVVLAGPTDDRRATLVDAYVSAATLDGRRLAPLLRGKPVLMLHGTSDQAVPAALGDELWRLAGEPERWVFPVGHELLFAGLNFQAGRLARWLDEHADGTTPSADAPAPGAGAPTGVAP